MGRAISSAGEHYIDIVGVTGSIPVSPTIHKYLKNIDKMGFKVNILPKYLGKSCHFLTSFCPVCRQLLSRIRPVCSMLVLVFAINFLYSPAAEAAPPATGQPPAKGRTTGYWATVDHITDGDTFWADGVKYRVIDIDTAETSPNRRYGYECEAERRLGELATQEAEALLLNRKVWIKPSGTIDRYNRPLVKVRYARDKWYGEHMIETRLAARWKGRKHNWCAPTRL